MILDESITTALDSIKANLLRSLLTTIAIVIGTASVIAMAVSYTHLTLPTNREV